ncbi:MAG TPA: CHASE domain-containing protein [Candidatus Limnocylindria bacterium]|nr:CHASE domain-containing protein [Candidatus Limnocylindria bacterium]
MAAMLYGVDMSRLARIIALLRLTTLSVILFIMSSAIGAALYVNGNVQQLSGERFNQTVDRLDTHILERMGNYADLLYSSRSYAVSTTQVTQEQWNAFFRNQSTFDRHPGISTVSYLRFFNNAQKSDFLRQMQAQPYFGGKKFAIRPAGTRDRYAVIQYVSTNNDVKGTFGIDSYAGRPQRQAMDTAVGTGLPQATELFTLGSGKKGFAIFLPAYKNDAVDGFSMISFRTEDFIKALFTYPEPHMRYKIADVSDRSAPQVLHHSANWQDGLDLERKDTIDIMGRQWEVTFAADSSYNVSMHARILPVLIVLVGVLLIAPVLIAFRKLTGAGSSS